jgi:hypothetical protein
MSHHVFAPQPAKQTKAGACLLLHLLSQLLVMTSALIRLAASSNYTARSCQKERMPKRKELAAGIR